MARVNVFLHDDLLEAVNQEAASEGENRSQWIQEALKEYLRARKKMREEKAKQVRMQKAARELDRLAAKLGDWDPAEVIRRFRDSHLREET